MANRDEKSLSQKLAAKSIRIRERNLSHQASLNRKVAQLEDKWHTYDKIIDKQIRDVRASLPEYKGRNLDFVEQVGFALETTPSPVKRSSTSTSYNSSCSRASSTKSAHSVRFPQLEGSSDGFARRRSKSPSRRSKKKRLRKCKVQSAQSRCVHFPCVKPTTYNTMAFIDVDEIERHSGEPQITGRALSAKSKYKLYDEVTNATVRRPLRSSSEEQISLREKGLQKIVGHMRKKNEATKPPDWCLNYGKPTPLRKILKAARAT